MIYFQRIFPGAVEFHPKSCWFSKNILKEYFQRIFAGAAEFNLKSCGGECWQTVRLGRGEMDEDHQDNDGDGDRDNDYQ